MDNNEIELYKIDLIKQINRYRFSHGAKNLINDTNIDRIAQKFANELCRKENLDYSYNQYKGQDLGETVYQSVGFIAPLKLIKILYDENKDYNYQDRNPEPSNFTQMVWRSSEFIGFGMQKNASDKYFFVINYFPTGNVDSQFKNNVLPFGSRIQSENNIINEIKNSSNKKEPSIRTIYNKREIPNETKIEITVNKNNRKVTFLNSNNNNNHEIYIDKNISKNDYLINKNIEQKEPIINKFYTKKTSFIKKEDNDPSIMDIWENFKNKVSSSTKNIDKDTYINNNKNSSMINNYKMQIYINKNYDRKDNTNKSYDIKDTINKRYEKKPTKINPDIRKSINKNYLKKPTKKFFDKKPSKIYNRKPTINRDFLRKSMNKNKIRDSIRKSIKKTDFRKSINKKYEKKPTINKNDIRKTLRKSMKKNDMRKSINKSYLKRPTNKFNNYEINKNKEIIDSDNRDPLKKTKYNYKNLIVTKPNSSISSIEVNTNKNKDSSFDRSNNFSNTNYKIIYDNSHKKPSSALNIHNYNKNKDSSIDKSSYFNDSNSNYYIYSDGKKKPSSALNVINTNKDKDSSIDKSNNYNNTNYKNIYTNTNKNPASTMYNFYKKKPSRFIDNDNNYSDKKSLLNQYLNNNKNSENSNRYKNKINNENKREHHYSAPKYEANEGNAEFCLEALDAHNKYRKKHHAEPLKLNKELCKIAENYSNHLAKIDRLLHSDNTFHGDNLGENIYCCGGMDPTGQKVTDSWYSEIKQYNYDDDTWKNGTGHFTQIIWKETKEVGFGKSTNQKGKTFVVGNYYPAGNVIGYFKYNVLRP